MSIVSPTPKAIAAAAKVIQDGGVIVMPTETVYGLACNALDAKSVEKVYEIKGRPSENPLIVHIQSWEAVAQVAASWSADAELLAKKYWPGPLTLVLPKLSNVPDQTTAGLDTVAVRVPRHPVALDLIRAAGCPIAAPSANVFMGLSPTRAEDVTPEIEVEVDFILDGGPCEVGLESTVIDVSSGNPRILRPGLISRAEIQSLLGRPLGERPPGDLRRSPGIYPRHYAPKALLLLVETLPAGEAGLVFSEPQNSHQLRMPRDPQAYSALLYRYLRRLDDAKVGIIYVVTPPNDPSWEAVNDRLKKASHLA